MLKLYIVPSRVPRTKLSFLIPCPPTRFNGRQSHSFSGFLGKGMWLRGFASIKDSPSPPISTESLQTSESHLQDPLEGDPEIRTLSDEIVSINARISRNELKLENVESELMVLLSASNVDPGSEQKRDRLEEAIKYCRTKVTQLMAIELSLRDDKAKKEAELVDRKKILVDRKHKSDESLKKEQNRLKWSENNVVTKRSSVFDSTLFFVNRSDAAAELISIHRDSFSYRANTYSGVGPQVPIIDSGIGMGKSTFAGRYIDLCRQSPFVNKKISEAAFRDSILNSRTILVRLGGGSLIENWIKGPTEAEKFLVKEILAELNRLIISGKMSGNISQFAELSESAAILAAIILETRNPLFFVLDEIPSAFEKNEIDVVTRRNMFMNFCKKVLADWFKVKDLYFLLIGRGDIFNIVGNRLNGDPNILTSPFEFTRISLRLIELDNIKKVLTQTLKKDAVDQDEVPLTAYYGVADDELEKTARHVQAVTSGHPRSMLRMFQRCPTKESLWSYSGIEDTGDVDHWKKQLIPYGVGIRKLIHAVFAGTEIDLTQPVLPVEKSITLVALAEKANIRFEGQIGAARLYAADNVCRLLSTSFSPFREFISFYGKHNFKYDHAANFELACMKRFQEMFFVPTSPRSAYPQWFRGTAFGKIDKFGVSPEITKIPKITSTGITSFSSFNQPTVSPECVPQLVQAMEDMEPRCFIPLEKSASSDVIIMSEAERNGQSWLVTIGLAAKCFSTSVLSETDISKELYLFNRFAQAPKPFTRDRANFLFICNTGPPNTERREKQRSRNFSIVETRNFKNITQAVYLDLSTEELRASFFGLLDDDKTSRENLDNMIWKESN